MRQEKEGGARARWRESRWNGFGDRKEEERRRAGRRRAGAGSNAGTETNQIATGAGTGARPSGSVTRGVMGFASAWAFSTTLVVAGLKAEPVILLDGGPRGARALNSATPSDNHKHRMKSRPPGPASFLYGVGVMRDNIPSAMQDRNG